MKNEIVNHLIKALLNLLNLLNLLISIRTT